MKKFLIVSVIIATVFLTAFLPKLMIRPGHLGKGHEKMENKCLSCHQPFSGISSAKCISCHQLNKIGTDSTGQAVIQKILFHKDLQTTKCTSCHTDHRGFNGKLTTSNFDHQLISSSIISNCNSCHNSPVSTFHQQLTVTACKNCHTTQKWKPASFDHKMLSTTIAGNCGSCHKAPGDNFHTQQLSGNCTGCHSTEKWKPSTFQHDKFFVFDNRHSGTCINCHTTQNFSQYTCTNCHEHNLPKLISEHSEEGITNINRCADCHKSGDEHNIESGNGKNGNYDMEKVRKYQGENNKKGDDD